MEDDGSYGGGRRSLRYEFSREPNGSTVSTTLGGILSIKETTSSYRIQNRTLLDLIRNDPTSENNNNNNNNDSKKPWKKMFREKLRLKLAGSVCTTTVPVLASLIHINTDNNRTDRLNSPLPLSNSNGNTSNVPVTQTANRTSPLISPLISNNNASIVPVSLTATNTNMLNTPLVSNNNTSSVTVTLTENSTNMLNTPPVSNRNSYTSSVPVTQQVNGTDLLNSPSVSHSNSNTSSVRYTQTENVRSEQVEENSDGGEATEKVSLMRLLEVEGSACFEEMVVEDGGDGGGNGGEGYNNCCVCMVRHKGAAFIPCGHTFCRLCSRELFVKRANCPLCNNFIVEILDIF